MSEGTTPSRAEPRLMETTDELPAKLAADLVLGPLPARPAARRGRVRHGLRRHGRAPAARRRGQGDPLRRRRRPDAGAARGAGRRPARPPRRSSRSSTPARTRRRATWSPSWSTAGPSTTSAPRALLSDRDVLRIGLALCGALEHAHERGVVHRDVKPQNVIVPDAPRSRRRRGQARRLRRRPPGGRRAAHAHRRRGRHARLHGARAGRGQARSTSALRPLQPRARALRGARGRQPRARRLAGGDRAPRRHRAARRSSAPARTCRRSCARRSTARCGPSPDERGTLDELGRRAGRRAPRGLRRRRHRRPPPARARRRCRCRAALARGARRRWPPAACAARGAGLGRAAASCRRWPPSPPSRCSRALGWLVAAAATIAVALGRAAGRRAARRPPRSLPVPLLLYRHGTAWSVPAARAAARRWRRSPAPIPALAGRAHGWFARAALGALGAWWALLAAPLLDATCSPDRSAHEPSTRRPGARAAARSGVLLYAAVWAVAAALLPWLVRGRWLAARSRRARPPGPPRSAPRRRRGGRIGAQSRAGSCSRASSPGVLASRYPTSVELEWWSRDAGPDTVHRQSWPSRPRSRA